jgi:hypothetical protein
MTVPEADIKSETMTCIKLVVLLTFMLFGSGCFCVNVYMMTMESYDCTTDRFPEYCKNRSTNECWSELADKCTEEIVGKYYD